MSAIGAPVSSPKRGGIVGWIKRNKLLASGAAVGATVLLLSRSGNGDASGGASILDTSGNESTVSDGPVQLVPVSAPASEGSTDSDFTDTTGDGTDQIIDDSGTGLDPGTTVVVNVPQPTVAQPATAPAPASTSGQGVTVSGKFFPGATSSVRTGVNRNQYGDYQVWKITYPGRSEYWWHYVKQGNWTGPHSGTHGDDVMSASAVAAAANQAQAQQTAAANQNRQAAVAPAAPAAAPANPIKNKSAALSALSRAASTVKNSNVKAQLNIAKAHIDSGHGNLALSSLDNAIRAGADADTTSKINAVRQYI